MLFEVYKCVQLNRCYVVCGCVLQRGRWDRTDVGQLDGEWAGESEGGKIEKGWTGKLVCLVSVGD